MYACLWKHVVHARASVDVSFGYARVGDGRQVLLVHLGERERVCVRER